MILSASPRSIRIRVLDGAIETIELTSSGRVISLPAGSVKAPSASEEACPDDAETTESAAEVSESPETAAEAPEVSSAAASLTDETLWAAELSAEASDEPQPDRTAAVIADARTTLSNDFFIIFSSLSRFYLKDTNNGIFDFLWIHSHRNNRRSRNPFPAPHCAGKYTSDHHLSASRMALFSVFRTFFLSALHCGSIRSFFGPSPVMRCMTISGGRI